MNKVFLTKLFKIISGIAVLIIALIGIIIFVTGRDVRTKSIGIGLAVGVLLGGLYKIKYKVPRLFIDKDERTIGITVLTKLISETFFGVSAYLCFVLTAAGSLHFDPLNPLKMLIYVALLIGAANLVDKVTYRLLDNKL